MKEPVKPVVHNPTIAKRPAPILTPQPTAKATVKADPNKTVMKSKAELEAAAPRPEKVAPTENANDINDPQKRHEAQLKGDR